MNMQGLTPGRIVHYVLPDGMSKGEHRPAIIVRVFQHASGIVNLQVFTDFLNDYDSDSGAQGRLWQTSVSYGEDKEPGTWHWIEPA